MNLINSVIFPLKNEKALWNITKRKLFPIINTPMWYWCCVFLSCPLRAVWLFQMPKNNEMFIGNFPGNKLALSCHHIAGIVLEVFCLQCSILQPYDSLLPLYCVSLSCAFCCCWACSTCSKMKILLHINGN